MTSIWSTSVLFSMKLLIHWHWCVSVCKGRRGLVRFVGFDTDSLIRGVFRRIRWKLYGLVLLAVYSNTKFLRRQWGYRGKSKYITLPKSSSWIASDRRRKNQRKRFAFLHTLTSPGTILPFPSHLNIKFSVRYRTYMQPTSRMIPTNSDTGLNIS